MELVVAAPAGKRVKAFATFEDICDAVSCEIVAGAGALDVLDARERVAFGSALALAGREVDEDALLAPGVAQRIDAGAADERVLAVAGDERVVPVATVHRVVAVAAVDHIVPGPAVDLVVADAALELVVAVVAVDGVVAVVAFQSVLPAPPSEVVAA